MEHIVRCGKSRPLWLETFALLKSMGEDNLDDTSSTAILAVVVTNTNNISKKTSDTVRATIRIAFRQHYAALVRVETEAKPYDWMQVFLHTLHSLRTVATARGERTTVRLERARFTSRDTDGKVSDQEQKLVAPLLQMDDEGEYTVNPEVANATLRISAAIKAKRVARTRTYNRPPAP